MVVMGRSRNLMFTRGEAGKMPPLRCLLLFLCVLTFSCVSVANVGATEYSPSPLLTACPSRPFVEKYSVFNGSVFLNQPTGRTTRSQALLQVKAPSDFPACKDVDSCTLTVRNLKSKSILLQIKPKSQNIPENPVCFDNNVDYLPKGMGRDTKLCRAEIYSRLFSLVVDDLTVAVSVDARKKPYSPKQWKSCDVEEHAYAPGLTRTQRLFYFDGMKIYISMSGRTETFNRYVHFWGQK